MYIQTREDIYIILKRADFYIRNYQVWVPFFLYIDMLLSIWFYSLLNTNSIKSYDLIICLNEKKVKIPALEKDYIYEFN